MHYVANISIGISKLLFKNTTEANSPEFAINSELSSYIYPPPLTISDEPLHFLRVQFFIKIYD